MVDTCVKKLNMYVILVGVGFGLALLFVRQRLADLFFREQVHANEVYAQCLIVEVFLIPFFCPSARWSPFYGGQESKAYNPRMLELKLASFVVEAVYILVFIFLGYFFVVFLSLGNLGVALGFLTGIVLKYSIVLLILMRNYKSKVSTVVDKLHLHKTRITPDVNQ